MHRNDSGARSHRLCVLDSANQLREPASTPTLRGDAMPNSTSDLSSLASRIEKLERQNRLFKRGGLVLLLSAATLIVMGQARPNRTMGADEFVLRDSSGKKWAALQMSQTEPYEIPEAVPPMKVPAGPYPNLTFYGVNGEKRAVLGASSLLSSLALFDYTDNPKIILSNLGGNLPSLRLETDGAKTQVEATANRPLLSLVDKDGFEAQVGSSFLVTPGTGESHRKSAASDLLPEN